MIPCPTDDELACFVDGALSYEKTDRLRGHVARCPLCRDRDRALRELIADVKGAASVKFDAQAHARAVMDRLDRPLEARTNPGRRPWVLGAAAAVGLLVLVGYRTVRVPLGSETWQPRGSDAQATIGRDVGVQPYAVKAGLRPLVSGSTIDRATPLTAGFRNLGDAPAFLLLFGVDSHRAVHWISPMYTRSEDDPASTTLTASTRERILDATVVFDDLSAGPLRVIAVITSTPARVSDVESLAGAELSAALLTRRLPGAEVRETIVDVRDAEGGPR